MKDRLAPPLLLSDAACPLPSASCSLPQPAAPLERYSSNGAEPVTRSQQLAANHRASALEGNLPALVLDPRRLCSAPLVLSSAAAAAAAAAAAGTFSRDRGSDDEPLSSAYGSGPAARHGGTEPAPLEGNLSTLRGPRETLET